MAKRKTKSKKEKPLTYAFVVKLVGGFDSDTYTFTVAAHLAEQAIAKAKRQARKDSGFARWSVVELERGGWIVS